MSDASDWNRVIHALQISRIGAVEVCHVALNIKQIKFQHLRRFFPKSRTSIHYNSQNPVDPVFSLLDSNIHSSRCSNSNMARYLNCYKTLKITLASFPTITSISNLRWSCWISIFVLRRKYKKVSRKCQEKKRNQFHVREKCEVNGTLCESMCKYSLSRQSNFTAMFHGF